MDKHDIEYISELRKLKECIGDEFNRCVFDIVLWAFRKYKNNARQTKLVSKELLITNLVRKGFMQIREDGTKPDDRQVRAAARELLKQGYPIIASSKNKGYFIAECAKELEAPQKENHSRAVAILAVDKGYDKARAFIQGQGRIYG